jgi:Uma2 family endonuclease
MATASPEAGLGMTAEEFARQADDGGPSELVKGRIVTMTPPGAKHGWICNKVGRLLGNFAEKHDLGHVLNNDSGVITRRAPDSVRGADVAFYSYARLPKGSLPATYPDVAPDLIVEILSPADRWPKAIEKVAEYLSAGVSLVIVLDDANRSAQLFDAERGGRTLAEGDDLVLETILPGFHVVVRQFFE